MDLKSLLTEGEALYSIYRMNGRTISVIGPQVEDTGRGLDLSGCIEGTLHRLLDHGATKQEIFELLDADERPDYNEAEGDYYVDLSYVIPEFYPTEVVKTGIVYQRPVHVYVAHTNIVIPDDPTDDEVLEAARIRFGINPEQYIVRDVGDDGWMFVIRPLID